MKQVQIDHDVDILRQSLGVLPEAVANPPFVIVSGLPGTGKSFFSRKLAERTPFCIVESDVMRKALFPSSDYSAGESARLFTACHKLIEELLDKGIPLIFDATNLSERHREYLYRISDKTGAKLILVRIEVSPKIAHQRLLLRSDKSNHDDNSSAGVDIYKRMTSSVEKINRNHFAVDTSRDISPVIDKIIRIINH